MVAVRKSRRGCRRVLCQWQAFSRHLEEYKVAVVLRTRTLVIASNTTPETRNSPL